MKWLVNNPDGFATSLKEFAGANLTLFNSSPVDVYYDVQLNGAGLNASAPGTVPQGTKITNGGGFVQFNEAPKDLWVRSATQTQLDVQANAPEAKEQIARVLAGNSLVLPDPPKKPMVQIGMPMRYKG